MNKLLIASIWIWIAVIIFNPFFTEDPVSNQSPTYDHITTEIIDHVDNWCALSFDDHVYRVTVRYFDNTEENKTLAGEWISSEKKIVLSNTIGLDVDTVAHEVAHAVDTIMRVYEIKDAHYRPYIQGRLTGCIWELVDEDTNRFKFAN